jgi:hypothetical protein
LLHKKSALATRRLERWRNFSVIPAQAGIQQVYGSRHFQSRGRNEVFQNHAL